MTSNTFIKIKRPTKATPQPQELSQIDEQLEIESIQPFEIEGIEQSEPPVQLESLAEAPPDESIFGTGWNVTELLNEFSGR